MNKILTFFSWIIFSIPVFCQDQLIYSSPLLPGNDTVWVFKPSGYNTTLNYPVVYLLHGWSGNYRSWNELIDVQSFADKYHFLIVCPDGFYDSYYLNSPRIENSQFESFFIFDLYPDINKKYSTDTAEIFITGLSMGGGGAMYLFLKHPELFLSAGSTSGLMDLKYSGNRDTKLSQLLGDYTVNQAVFDHFSPVNLLENLKDSGKEIFFDCGTEDYLFQSNHLFNLKCKELGIKATFMTAPGEHNSAYWKKSIKYHFLFFKELAD